MSSQQPQNSGCAWLLALFAGLYIFGSLTKGCKQEPPAMPSVLTEREKQEGAARAILREFGRKGMTEREIRQGAREVVDEWERAKRGL